MFDEVDGGVEAGVDEFGREVLFLAGKMDDVGK